MKKFDFRQAHWEGHTSAIREGLREIAESEGDSFFLWESNRAKIIQVECLEDLVTDQQTRELMIAQIELKDLKDPYRCAVVTANTHLSPQDEGVYCEGWLIGIEGCLFRHAWNSIDGRYFDVTHEAVRHALKNPRINLGLYIKTFSCTGPAAEVLKQEAFWMSRREGIACYRWYKTVLTEE